MFVVNRMVACTVKYDQDLFGENAFRSVTLAAFFRNIRGLKSPKSVKKMTTGMSPELCTTAVRKHSKQSM